MAVKGKVFDFTGVSDGSGYRPKRKLAGEYRAVITGVEEKTSKADNEMWVFSVKLESDPTAIYPVHCTLDEKSLWKLRNLVMATGATVPKKRVKIDPNKLVGRKIGIILDDHEFEGKETSQVTATLPVSEITEEVEEEEPTPARRSSTAKKTAAKKAAPVDEEDDDDVDDEDLEELDLEEL